MQHYQELAKWKPLGVSLACLFLFAACSSGKISSSSGSTTATPQGTSTGSSVPPTTGSATLTWVAPTVNTDGTPIANLAGYHVYYGPSASAMGQVLDVSGAATLTVSVENLSAGTYYFSVVAYNTDGVDSGPSNTASKTI
jgi:hypothetical protein